MQPIYKDEHGTLRFQGNEIVRYLLDNSAIDLNALALLEFSQADREQFAQLIGYSVSGYHELSYVSDESADEASAAACLAGLGKVGCRLDGCQIHSGVERER